MRTVQFEKGGPYFPVGGGSHVTIIMDDEINDTDAFCENEGSKVPLPTESNVHHETVMLGAVNDV